MINSYIGSSHLVSRSFPIVFHALYGKDDREASSPSFFNIDEVTQVKTYVETLRADRRYRIGKFRKRVTIIMALTALQPTRKLASLHRITLNVIELGGF